MRTVYALTLSFAVAAFAQQPKQAMSMEFTTAALRTLRCLKGAASVDEVNPCRAEMSGTEDLMRTADERKAFGSVAQYAVARIRFIQDRADALEEVKMAWTREHPVASSADYADLEKKQAAALTRPDFFRRFESEAACETALDGVLRAQRMKPLTGCTAYFAEVKAP